MELRACSDWAASPGSPLEASGLAGGRVGCQAPGAAVTKPTDLMAQVARSSRGWESAVSHGPQISCGQDCLLLEAREENLFPGLFQLLEVPTFLGSWPLPSSSESGVLLSPIIAGKESCRQLVPTWVIQLLSQLQTFNFITCRVDSDCSGFIPGLRSFLPEATPAPGSVHLKGRGSGDSGSFSVNLGAPLSLPQPCG